MLGIHGREDQWCCACGAHDGTVELRVGEPPRRGLLRRRDGAGEAWLREHGWVPVNDAWARPEPALGDEACAGYLAAALEHALRADPAAPLEHILTHPGVLDGADPPPHDAPLEQHIATAFQCLVRAGEGSYHVDSGRPARLRAWVSANNGVLLIEREVPGVAASPGETWHEPLTPAGADAAAAALAHRERADRPTADTEPWLLGYVTPQAPAAPAAETRR